MMIIKKIGLYGLVLALTQMAGGVSFAASSDCKPKYDLKTVEEGVLTVAAVPEPSSWAMLLAGVGILGFIVRRRTNGFTV